MSVFKLDTKNPWADQDFPIPEYKDRPTVCITRYGGFGDMIQAASVFPYFRDLGYHVTVNTTPQGHEIVEHDPNIDDFFLQEINQVPQTELPEYWDKLGEHFDLHVQLSESVEGALLAVLGREEYSWSKEKRHEAMDKNYLENIHRLAGASSAAFAPLFYPTIAEDRKAKAQRGKFGRKSFVILWSLAGSSPHKTWPYVDNVIMHLLDKYEHVKIVLVGDTLCQILEMGWENERRVICKSGRWSIRKSLSMIPHMDLIIGTETGILNSAGFVNVPKLLMLSHSTEENLTKHWVDTTAFMPEDTYCYPCHKLHTKGFKYCNRDETIGVAVCAANIGYDRVISAIEQILQRRSAPGHEHIS